MELGEFAFRDVIAQAARGRLKVRLSYPEGGEGGDLERMVEPYSYRESPKGGTLFYGYDEGRGDIRAFRLEKISNVEPTEEPYSERWEVEIA